MSLLTPGKQPVGFSVDRDTELRGYDKLRLPRFDRISRLEKLKCPGWRCGSPAKNRWCSLLRVWVPERSTIIVVVLVNEHTTCASEMVALFARQGAGAERSSAQLLPDGWPVTHTGFKIGHGFTLALPIAPCVGFRRKARGVDGNGINLRPCCRLVVFRCPKRRG